MRPETIALIKNAQAQAAQGVAKFTLEVNDLRLRLASAETNLTAARKAAEAWEADLTIAGVSAAPRYHAIEISETRAGHKVIVRATETSREDIAFFFGEGSDRAARLFADAQYGTSFSKPAADLIP